MHEDTFYALLLPTNTTTAKLFKPLSDYISGKLNWSFCVGIYTGWFSVSLFGSKRLLLGAMSESTHCVIHRKMLASQKMNLIMFCRM